MQTRGGEGKEESADAERRVMQRRVSRGAGQAGARGLIIFENPMGTAEFVRNNAQSGDTVLWELGRFHLGV